MNDNLYQSKAGVFTPGWFLWPAITIPSSRQIRIMMMHCNCRMETCTSLQWRFSSMPQHWCPATLRYVRQVTLLVFSVSFNPISEGGAHCAPPLRNIALNQVIWGPGPPKLIDFS